VAQNEKLAVLFAELLEDQLLPYVLRLVGGSVRANRTDLPYEWLRRNGRNQAKIGGKFVRQVV
jgi:hypothetical protein